MACQDPGQQPGRRTGIAEIEHRGRFLAATDAEAAHPPYAAKLAGIRGEPDLETKWAAVADEIKADILANGLTPGGALRQHYDTDDLDASTLLAAIREGSQ